MMDSANMSYVSSGSRSDSQIEGISLSGGLIRSLASSETNAHIWSLATHVAAAEIMCLKRAIQQELLIFSSPCGF